MRTQATNERRPSRSRAGGFTLIEILSAMMLAVIIMLGVAQVFKMSTEAVSEAEAVSDGYRQGRGVLGMLQQDLAAMSPEGYLSVIPYDMTVPSRYQGGSHNVVYRFDTLCFTALGVFEAMGGTVGAGQQPACATAGEVVYGPGVRVRAGVQMSPYERIEAGDNDARTMMLTRKVFLVSSTPKAYVSPGLRPGDPVDPADIKGPRSCLALMMTDRWYDGQGMAYPYARYRVSPPGAYTTWPMIHVEPTLKADGFPTYQPDVNWVLADRVSEFFVEVWANVNGAHRWVRLEPATPDSKGMTWAGAAPNLSPSFPTQRTMPHMIRVTLVVHEHSDTTPLSRQAYTGDIPKDFPMRYRGMVFRQVFRINGQVNGQ